MSHENPYASPAAEHVADRHVGEFEPPQSVEFWLTEEDVLALMERINAASPSVATFIRRRRRRVLLVSLLMGLLGTLNIMSGGGLEVLGYGLLAAAVTMALASLRMRSAIRRNTAKFNKELLENEAAYWFDRPHTASLFEEGFQVSDKNGHWFQYWRAMPTVESTDSMLIVYRTPSQAVGVPSRAFFDEAAFSAFCRLAERLWREAKQQAESAPATTPAQ